MLTLKTKHYFNFFLIVLSLWGCSRLIVKEPTHSPIWPQLGGNPARTNFTTQKLQLPLQLLWDRRASTTIGPTLVVADGVVFYGTLDGRIEAVEITTGKSVGKIKTRRDDESTCAYWQNSLFVVYRMGRHTLSLFDLSYGKTVWQQKIGNVLTEPLVTDNAVYLALLEGTIIKLETLTGKKKWSVNIESQVHSTPAYANGSIVFGNDAGEVTAVSAEDGTRKWQFSTESAVVAPPMLSSGTVYIGSTNNRFYALRLSDGQELWHFKAGGKLYNGAAAVDSLVLFGSTDHYLYCLNTGTGKLVWKFEAGSVVGTNPVIANDVVFFGSLAHVLYALDIHTGQELWSFELDGRIRTSPVVVDGRLLVASEYDLIYCFGNK